MQRFLNREIQIPGNTGEYQLYGLHQKSYSKSWYVCSAWKVLQTKQIPWYIIFWGPDGSVALSDHLDQLHQEAAVCLFKH